MDTGGFVAVPVLGFNLSLQEEKTITKKPSKDAFSELIAKTLPLLTMSLCRPSPSDRGRQGTTAPRLPAAGPAARRVPS